MKKNIFLVSDEGGHFEQIKLLEELKSKHEVFYITEKTQRTINRSLLNKNQLLIPLLNRNIPFWYIVYFKTFTKSLLYILKYKPDIIISTGALSAFPTLLIGKILGKKIIFIETYSRFKSRTLTGKIIYKLSLYDYFIIQHKTLRKLYPKAIYGGSIY